jgi:hypothetical protein
MLQLSGVGDASDYCMSKSFSASRALLYFQMPIHFRFWRMGIAIWERT